MLTVGSLFAGIGGIEKGLEDTGGFVTKWQVELDDYTNKVLEKHWPAVTKHRDVRTFPPPIESPWLGQQWKAKWGVDLICGGFPCQDISACNYRAKGLDGKRSGLWFQFARIIRTLRPKYVIAENVPAITFRGLNRVLCDLAASGYDAEWNTLSAKQFGAPQQRDRLFIVAYPASERLKTDAIFGGCTPQTASQEQASRIRLWPGRIESGGTLPDRVRWCPDSKLCRMVDGVPDRLDRYRCLGNSVWTQVAEYIGRQILNTERKHGCRRRES